jgi:mannose-6-phosphate isomerase-like protein (cupin superfamily)
MRRDWREMRSERRNGRANGVGMFNCTHVLEPGDSKLGVQFIHDNILDAGCTFGPHRHDDSEEIYYVLDGYGTLLLDDESYPLSPGSVSVVHAGHSHGIENDSGSPLRFMAVGVKGSPSDSSGLASIVQGL